MGRVAVLMAEGYEEGETLTIVDLLRRGGLECHTFSFNEEFVRGMHGMYVKADKYFNDEIKNYDMLVLPGGRPGGQNLLENQDVISLVQYFNEHHQYIAAMCSGTVVLEKANPAGRGRPADGGGQPGDPGGLLAPVRPADERKRFAARHRPGF